MEKRWVVFGVAAAAIVATGAAAPSGFGTRVVSDTVIVGAVVFAWVGALQPARDRRAWVLLAAGLTAWGVGDLIWDAYAYLGADRPGVSAADVLYLAGYPLLAAGILRMVRMRAPGHHREGLLDGMTFAIAAGFAAWEFLVVPMTREALLLESVVWGAYPLADALLLGAAAWLVLAPGDRTRPALLLLGFLVSNLVIDVAYAAIPLLDETFDTAVLDPAYPISYMLLALAAAHPAAGTLTTPGPRRSTRMHPGRIVTLGVALVAAPVIAIGPSSNASIGARLFLLLASVALTSTVLGRFLLAVREREAAQDELEHRAAHDELTGLYNRPLLMERLAQALDRTRRRGGAVAVLFVDLDRFKSVNDTWGHSFGDQVLVEATARLRASLRPADFIARVGGDEFVVVCEDVFEPIDAECVAARVLDAFGEPVEIAERVVVLTASIGIALGVGTTAAEDLLQNADAAMYLAKQQGRNCFQQYDAGLREVLARRADVEGALHRALERGELEVHYQPVVTMESEQTVGFEALLRWNRPGVGVVGPGDFIDIAEEVGLIVPIGAWVIQEAAREAVEWNRGDGPPVWVSVNVSARQVMLPGFAETVERACLLAGADPHLLVIEITESVLVRDVAVAVEHFQRLKQLGVRVAVDDFGTGYSALAYLRQFPIDIVKIDRQFMRELGSLAPASTMVAAVMHLAHVLGHTVIAEGVETEVQRDALVGLGCDLAQGFLYSPALPAGEAGARLRPAQLSA